MSSDDDFVMHSKIRPYRSTSGLGFRYHYFIFVVQQRNFSQMFDRENKGMHQTMFAFVVVVANTVFAVSGVTRYDQSTSPVTTSFSCRRSLPGSTF